MKSPLAGGKSQCVMPGRLPAIDLGAQIRGRGDGMACELVHDIVGFGSRAGRNGPGRHGHDPRALNVRSRHGIGTKDRRQMRHLVGTDAQDGTLADSKSKGMPL